MPKRISSVAYHYLYRSLCEKIIREQLLLSTTRDYQWTTHAMFDRYHGLIPGAPDVYVRIRRPSAEPFINEVTMTIKPERKHEYRSERSVILEETGGSHYFYAHGLDDHRDPVITAYSLISLPSLRDLYDICRRRDLRFDQPHHKYPFSSVRLGGIEESVVAHYGIPSLAQGDRLFESHSTSVEEQRFDPRRRLFVPRV